jgi:glycosyltransferase involved in cell wall biosynthesis
LNSHLNNKLCIVIPVYNEQDCIVEVVDHWTQVLSFQQIDYTLILLNDGSTDNTESILKNMKKKSKRLHIINKENSGHGSTIYQGYQEAIRLKADWVFQVDSDNQFTPKDFISFWKLRSFDTIIQGVRKNRHDPQHRKTISKLLKNLIYFTHGLKIKDANCPFRLYPTRILKDFLSIIPSNSFAPNIFLSLLASKTKMLREISVTHLSRETGTVSIMRLNLIKACLTSFIQFILFRNKVSQFKLEQDNMDQILTRQAS